MQYNGTIQYKITSGGGGRDPKGNPIPVNSTWCEPIDCLIKTIKHNHNLYREGKFKTSSYEVSLETQGFDADMVKLTNDGGKILGEFEVQNVEDVGGSGRIKITV